MGKFEDQIKRFQRKYEKRLRATARTSVQEVVSLAQRVEGDGGQMRVDTGFLRASIQGATGTMPRGKTQPRKGAKKDEYAGQQVAGTPITAVIAKWDLGMDQPLHVGWTAAYARPREYKDGFLRLAVQNWDTIVIKEATIARAGIG